MRCHVMPTSIRLDENTEDRLRALARRTGRTKTFYIREAIREYLDEWEDYHIAVARLDDEEGEVPLAEVRRRLGLAG